MLIYDIGIDMTQDKASILNAMFKAAVAAAAPANCVPPHLPSLPKGRLVVLGAGKASAAMAAVVEGHYQAILEGLIITRYGHSVPTNMIKIIEAAHPIPDQAGIAATRRILDLADGLGEDDLALVLISGGGSALLTAPAGSLTLSDKQAVNQALLNSGAPISAMNCVRKHLSAVKGGRLALACAPAPVLCLMISDVPGDEPGLIASGPTVADNSSRDDARSIVRRYNIDLPEVASSWLAKPDIETPANNHQASAAVKNIVVAKPAASLAAAAEIARRAGYDIENLGNDLEGEASDVAAKHAAAAMAAYLAGKKVALISGGEATVTHDGSGRGGPNTEYALALVERLNQHSGICAIACDTDGIDGSEDNAGARVFPDSLARAQKIGLQPKDFLDRHDSYEFFRVLGDLVMGGPTLTNVNDFRAILIDP